MLESDWLAIRTAARSRRSTHRSSSGRSCRSKRFLPSRRRSQPIAKTTAIYPRLVCELNGKARRALLEGQLFTQQEATFKNSAAASGHASRTGDAMVSIERAHGRDAMTLLPLARRLTDQERFVEFEDLAKRQVSHQASGRRDDLGRCETAIWNTNLARSTGMVVSSIGRPSSPGLKRPLHRWHHAAARQEESIPSVAAVGGRV